MDVLVRCQLNNTIHSHGWGDDTWTGKINICSDILMEKLYFLLAKRSE